MESGSERWTVLDFYISRTRMKDFLRYREREGWASVFTSPIHRLEVAFPTQRHPLWLSIIIGSLTCHQHTASLCLIDIYYYYCLSIRACTENKGWTYTVYTNYPSYSIDQTRFLKSGSSADNSTVKFSSRNGISIRKVLFVWITFVERFPFIFLPARLDLAKSLKWTTPC